MKKLDNYLRTYRRRTGLSQRDVARLLGVARAEGVSRYEHGRRTPDLVTALACEALLGASLRELFSGLYARVEQEVRQRARALVRELEELEPTEHRIRRLGVLRSLGCLQAVEDPSSHPHEPTESA